MARIGAFCFPGTGHINPMTALARRLQQRGHEVERVKNIARMVLRDGPEAVRRAQVDAILVDEADMGGNVAEHLGLPYVSIAFFPPLVQDDRIPPFCFGWNGGQGWPSRLRNRLGFRLLSRVAAPIFAVVNEQRGAWGLKPLKRSTDALSPLAQVAQLPAVLEFEIGDRPPLLHYTGPFVDARQRPRGGLCVGAAGRAATGERISGHAAERIGRHFPNHRRRKRGS